MQSSTVVTCRALVMLVCLIAIPLVALFGTSLPDTAKALLGGREEAGLGSSRDPLGVGAVAGQTAGASAPSSGSQAKSAWPPAGLGRSQEMAGSGLALQPASAQHSSPTRPAEAVQAGYEEPAGRPTSAAANPAPWGAAAPTRPDVANTPAALPYHAPPRLVPVGLAGGREAPPGRRAPAAGPGSGPSTAQQQRQSLAPTDRFMDIQHRLRQLGATYYLLELWGSEGQYRFYCKMALGGNPDFSRYFEATDSDPLRAMAKVLAQVESWRAGRP